MSRWSDRDERDEEMQSGSRMADGLSRGGGDERPRAPEAKDEEQGFGSNGREIVLLRERSLNIRASEYAALATLGRFRVVEGKDLTTELYKGNKSLARADLAGLQRQGLIASAYLRDKWSREVRILALTRDGHDLARLRMGPRETVYWGFGKPAEALHDCRFYRAFKHEQRRLASEGYRVSNVTLDSDLKRGYFQRLNASADKRAYHERQADSARAMHLNIVEGRTTFPDFRIQYQDDRGDIGRVDVEVASDNYHDHHIATKLAAGFRVYGTASIVGRFGISEGGLGGGGFSYERSAVLLL